MIVTALVAWAVGSTIVGLTLGLIAHRAKALYPY